MHTDTVDGSLVTSTVPEVDVFGWTTFDALVRRETLRAVDTAAGAVPDTDILTMSQYLASRVLLQMCTRTIVTRSYEIQGETSR